MAIIRHAVGAVSSLDGSTFRITSQPQAQTSLFSFRNLLVRSLDLWHLASLDAPTVAVLWTSFIAKTERITLPGSALFAIGIAVWILYAADRLLDARILSGPPSPADDLRHNLRHDLSERGEDAARLSLSTPPLSLVGLEPRHHFHHRHYKAFRLAIVLASAVLALLFPKLTFPTIYLYLILGAPLSAYFILVHGSSHFTRFSSPRLPKELMVGIFFSAAAFIPTVSGNPALRLALLPGAILFSALCMLNCLFIYLWEHPATPSQTHPSTRIAVRFLAPLSVGIATSALILSLTDRSLPRAIPLSIVLAIFFLLLLHKNISRVGPTTLRACADLCLLTPLIFLYL